MVDPKVVNEWITKADEDFEFARINLEEHKPFFSQICFHFHQAAEKYLKAYIVANDLEFKKIQQRRAENATAHAQCSLGL
jgi:HEPN domain-containing protein